MNEPNNLSDIEKHIEELKIFLSVLRHNEIRIFEGLLILWEVDESDYKILEETMLDIKWSLNIFNELTDEGRTQFLLTVKNRKIEEYQRTVSCRIRGIPYI